MKCFRTVCLTVLAATIVFANAIAATQLTVSEVVPKDLLKSLAAAKPMPPDETRAGFLTWGGDFAPVFANGGKSTTPNSIFGKLGLTITFVDANNMMTQINAFRAGQLKYLRCTADMLPFLEQALPDIPTVAIGLMTDSNGGDRILFRDVKSFRELRGQDVLLSFPSMHVGFLNAALKADGLSFKDVKTHLVPDLTDTQTSVPEVFLKMKSIKAAAMLGADADRITGGGSGEADKSVTEGLTTRGTQTIKDIILVRSDFYASPAGFTEIHKFLGGMLRAQEELSAMADASAKKMTPDFEKAAVLLAEAFKVAKTEILPMLKDCRFAGLVGNRTFFLDTKNLRSFEKMVEEARAAYLDGGFIDAKSTAPKILFASTDFDQLASYLTSPESFGVFKPNKTAITAAVQAQHSQNLIDKTARYRFVIPFEPQQTTVNLAKAAPVYRQIITTLATFASGSSDFSYVMVSEGNADIQPYLKAILMNQPDQVKKAIRSKAKSKYGLERAKNVVTTLIDFARTQMNTELTEDQFEIVSNGIEKPATGIDASGVPIAPKTDEEWRSNLRVEFILVPIQLEQVEASSFEDLSKLKK